MTLPEAFSIVASPTEQLRQLLWEMNHGLTPEDLEAADQMALAAEEAGISPND